MKRALAPFAVQSAADVSCKDIPGWDDAYQFGYNPSNAGVSFKFSNALVPWPVGAWMPINRETVISGQGAGALFLFAELAPGTTNNLTGGIITPSPGELSSLLVSVSGKGAVIKLQAGAYTINIANLGALTSDIIIEGVSDGLDAGGAAIITFLNSQATNVAAWAHIVFRWVRLTFPVDGIANNPVFNGSNNTDIELMSLTVFDFGPYISSNQGDGSRNRFLHFANSGSPPTNMRAGWLNVLSNGEWSYNDFQPSQLQSGTIIAWHGVASTLYYRFLIEGNHFYDNAGSPLAGTDAAIDLEGGSAGTTMQDVMIRANLIFNTKIDINAGSSIDIIGNTFVYTSAYVPVQSGINVLNTGAQPIDELNIVFNHMYQLSTNLYTRQLIVIVATTQFRSIRVFRNTLIINGGAVSPSIPGAIGVRRPAAGTTSPWGDYLDISQNEIGYSSVPGAPQGAIHVDDQAGSGTTLTRGVFNDNRVLGVTPAYGYNPGTVAGNVASGLIELGAVAATTNIVNVSCHRNHTDDTGRTLVQLPIIAYKGTLTVTNLIMSDNTPVVGAATFVAPASGSSYTNTDGNAEYVQVIGGTITSLQYIPANSGGQGYTLTENAGGVFRLNPGDQIKFTYTVAPLCFKSPL